MPEQNAVPSIAPIQNGSIDSGSLDQLLGHVAEQAQMSLPSQYSQSTTIAQPRVAPVPQYQHIDNQRQPVNNQATNIKLARTQNNFAAIGNLVGMAGQRIQEQKQQHLVEDLKTVMQTKQNIANATAVLAQDPNNEMAKQVLAKNKESLNAVLSDPKKQKQLAKALDISFTDPEKNKTPEVQAYQTAAKEVKSAGAFNSSNELEHQVAQQAQAGGTNELGQKLPEGSQLPQGQGTQTSSKSATPYADQALAKDLPSIAENPQYAPALKQREEAQKALYTNVIPKVIEAESRAQVQLAKDGNAAARQQYKAVTDFNIQNIKAMQALKLQDKKDTSAMARRLHADATTMADTITRTNAMLKVASDKRLDKTAQDKLKTDSIANIDKNISTVTNTKLQLDKAMYDVQNDKTLSDKDKESRTTQLKVLQEANQRSLLSLNKFRMDKTLEAFGTYGDTNATGSESDITKIASGSGGASQVVGDGLSDEDDDSDTDSDDY